jgi:hypothetical protein
MKPTAETNIMSVNKIRLHPLDGAELGLGVMHANAHLVGTRPGALTPARPCTLWLSAAAHFFEV